MKNYSQENINYLKQLLGEEKVAKYNQAIKAKTNNVEVSIEDQEAYNSCIQCLDAMEKHENNHWWTSEDKKLIGYHQLYCEILLVDFSLFYDSVGYLLQRPVWDHEFGTNVEQLRKEAKIAFDKI